MTETGIGASVPRVEDRRFLTGSGSYSDDLQLPGQAHAVFLRSPHAHARIIDINCGAARQMPGVLAVWTAAELRQWVANPIPTGMTAPPTDVRNVDGGLTPDAAQYPLAEGKVRYLGEPVAVVVGETVIAAMDGADQILVDYEPLTPLMHFEDALQPDAPKIWEAESSNIAVDWQGGDAAAVARIFSEAEHVVKRDLVNNRVLPAFMEPRAALASYDAPGDRLTLQLGCQSPHGMQAMLCHILGLESEQLHILVPDMGGGFGARGAVYPEFPVLLAAARELNRPVGWTATRSEAMLSDTQARDHLMHGELALDGDGNFLAIRIHTDWRHGAYVTSRSTFVLVHFMPPTVGGAYRIPAADIAIRGVFTNTTPHAAYRGVGRAEATYILECLIDAAARELQMDPVALRRQNLIAATELPWTMAGGGVLTSGAFAENLDRALELTKDAEALPDLGPNWLEGTGVAMYVENDGSAPTEYAEVEAFGDGTVLLRVGTQDFGMGHTTIYAQIASDRLGLPFDSIKVLFGDTDQVKRGLGTHGSRSARMGGGAVVYGAEKMVERGRELAADLLEAAPADIQYQEGNFQISGTDRKITLAAVAAHAETQGSRLAGEFDFNTAGDVHANGVHLVRVAIDRDTGQIRLRQHVMVCDVGCAINPMIVHGQLHGGAAQGIGQALMENIVYDAASGQTLSGSLMDYCLPRADNLPMFSTELNEIAEVDNPLGVKGVGENATTGAPAAIINAVHDALAKAGAGEVQMPATSEQVWRALQSGSTAGG